MKYDVLVIGSRPRRHFYRFGVEAQRFCGQDRHRGKGRRHRKARLPQSKDAKMRGLQALLPYHHGIFGRGRVFPTENSL